MREIVGLVASATIEEDESENVITLPNMISKNVVDELADLSKVIEQEQGCVPSYRSIHLYVSRNWLIAGGYTPRVKDYILEETHFVKECL